jgi:hypothetical protein
LNDLSFEILIANPEPFSWQYNEFAPPALCPNPEGCACNQFQDVEQFSSSSCKDYQVPVPVMPLGKVEVHFISRVLRIL